MRFGAPDENRTHAFDLANQCSTIELPGHNQGSSMLSDFLVLPKPYLPWQAQGWFNNPALCILLPGSLNDDQIPLARNDKTYLKKA